MVHMVTIYTSPYVYSLFTIILLDETIDSCIENVYNDNKNTPKIPKDIFRNLINVATKESFFMFNNKFFKLIDCMAMEPSLGPTIANIFMWSFENNWSKVWPHGLNPVFYIDCMLMTYMYCFFSLYHAENFIVF